MNVRGGRVKVDADGGGGRDDYARKVQVFGRKIKVNCVRRRVGGLVLVWYVTTTYVDEKMSVYRLDVVDSGG